jgi:DNA primase
MFPVADLCGWVVGFGARALRDEQGPKYKNTPEGELYHKSRQLFGIDRARAAAAKQGRIFVVEGYTDVLALHQVGLEETVAVMGTAVTPEQLAVLSQTVGKGTAYLAMDADRAGRDAMLRAARAAKDRELELRVIDMPEGTDPADLVAQQGAEAFTRLVDSAATVVEFQIRRVLADSELETPRGRDRALDEVRPLIATIPQKTATRDELVSFVADRLDVPSDYVTTVLASARPHHARHSAMGPQGPRSGRSTRWPAASARSSPCASLRASWGGSTWRRPPTRTSRPRCCASSGITSWPISTSR